MKLPAAKLSAGRGFTLVELLIVIAIIGTLVGLLLPAVNAARARARQAQCLNNIKELGTAMVSFATKHDRFPGWAESVKTTLPATVVGMDADRTPANGFDLGVTWAFKILPEIDQQTLSEQIITNNNGAGPGLMDSNSYYLKPPRIEVFACPDDVGTNEEIGKLTYVVNSGYFDREGDGTTYIQDKKANGICDDLRPGRGNAKVRLGADIKDGGSTTLLLSENIHKDENYWKDDSIYNSWLAPISRFPSEYMNGGNAEQIYGMVWVFDNASPNLPSNQARLNKLPDSPPNSFESERQGYARPASEHPEVFNAAFVGGSAKSINENIEYRVYQQLMTPNGAKADALDYTGADKATILRNFMNPPLSESDF